jgi:aminoglycoside phosphotransferase (APT) family kinase protein
MAADLSIPQGDALARAMRRAGIDGGLGAPLRLSGGANLESWLFACGEDEFVLRRAPSAEWIGARPLSMAEEAALIRAARAAGVPAPEVVIEIEPEDALGIGFIMRRVPGSAEPAAVLASPPALAGEIAQAMARIHALDPAAFAFLPRLEPAAGVEALAAQFAQGGGDRPLIALGLAWLRANLPLPAPLRFVHGDLRVGNVMVDGGHLSAVLDWELGHLGDGHEDLAYGCMTVWRFSRPENPALGLTDVASFAAAYEAAGGEPFDPARFQFWLVYRTVWWALGCLGMGQAWRSGTDRSLERVVVARRAAEQELDLLMLLEAEAPVHEQSREMPPPAPMAEADQGEPSAAEILTAISEWLAAAVKPKLEGRERFELAVAQNALGIVRRELASRPPARDRALADAILAGHTTLDAPGLLAALRRRALDTASADMPKYPALAIARALWENA